MVLCFRNNWKLKSLPFCFGIWSFLTCHLCLAFWKSIIVVQGWTNCVPDPTWAYLGIRNFLVAPKFFVREENRFADFKSIGKTMKKLNWDPNAMVRTSLHAINWFTYRVTPKLIFYSWIVKQLITCHRTSQKRI